ncbi:hypothetical protein QTP88_010468 [Uroleucon formosanum]
MVILPSSFTGGPKYMYERKKDAMTYDEIKERLLLGQRSYDRHDIISRVFRKVKKTMNLLKKGNIFGEMRFYMYSTEWQKRGLPPVHILLWLQHHITPDQIDNVIRAEIADHNRDPELHEIVKSNIIPRISLRKLKLVMTVIRKNEKDEIKNYESGRYISSSEAVLRVFKFPTHELFSTVVHLAVPLENGQKVYFNEKNLYDRVNSLPTTTLLSFFDFCKVNEFAKSLLYPEIPAYYVWDKKKFQRRKRGVNVNGWPDIKKDHVLGRVYTVHPNNTECYHLHMLLREIRGPISFEALKTVNGQLYPTFNPPVKTTKIYKDAFSDLLDNIGELNLTIKSRIICTDFKQAIHLAISEIFPDVVRKGCRFHLGQTMWRKIQSLGLKPEEVQKCFSEDLMTLKLNNQQLNAFCDFFEKNYLLQISLMFNEFK